MRAMLIALLTTLLLGCGGLLREAPPTVWVALEPALPAGGAGGAGAPSLTVEDFATAPAFRHNQVPTRIGDSQWSFTTYYRWVADPGDMVAAAARDYLSRTGRLGAVFTPPGAADPDYRLSGAVRGLYWDRQRHTAVIEVEASLFAPPHALRGFWIYRKEAMVAGDEVQAYLQAASSALGLVLADLGRDIAAAIDAAPSPRTR